MIDYKLDLMVDKNGKIFPEEFELFEECAAISEYEGEVEREKAESIAFNSVLMHRKEIQTMIYESLYLHTIQNNYDYAVHEYLLSPLRKLTEESILIFKLFGIKNYKLSVEFLKDTFTEYELSVSGLFIKEYFILRNHRIFIPYIEKGRITMLRTRFWNGTPNNGKNPKYKSLLNTSKTLGKRFYNIDSLQNSNEIILCEGEFDTIIATQWGNSAIGIAGVTSFPHHQLGLLKDKTIYILFDNDEAGEKAKEKIYSVLSKNKIYTKKIKYRTKAKDLTEIA